MTSPDYIKKISDLRYKVDHYSKLQDPNSSKFGVVSSITSYIQKFNIRSPFFYIIPPFVLIILFLLIKPSIVCTDHIDKYNTITKKINYKKIIIYSLIGGGVIDIGLFAYFKTTNNKI
jgi:hypothetical protein